MAGERVVKLEKEQRTGRASEGSAPLLVPPPIQVRNAALTLLAALAVILVLKYLQPMVIPIVVGILISYALEPIVAWMARWHIPRTLASGSVAPHPRDG